jgi:hypothetical protein
MRNDAPNLGFLGFRVGELRFGVEGLGFKVWFRQETLNSTVAKVEIMHPAFMHQRLQ